MPPLGEPRDPEPRPPGTPVPHPQSPPPAPASTAGSGQAAPVPIAYGTVKLPIQVIEKFAPFVQSPDPWVTGSFNVGQFAANVGNAYECITAGTSITGPTGTALDFTDGGTAHWKYRQQLPFPIYLQFFLGALCEGEVVGALSVWFDKEHIASPALTFLPKSTGLRVGPDAANQTVPGSFDQAAYQHTALMYPLGIGNVTGTQSEMMNIAVELQAVMLGFAGPDVSPADIVNDLLTHSRRGVKWPSSRVDTSITGTAAGGYRVYCDAAGLRFSMAATEQKPALDWIDLILEATNSNAVWSGGALKIVPLGDQPIASPVYGSTGYVPANTPVYDLTLDDFLDHDIPIQTVRRDDADCFNSFPIEFTDRSQAYSRSTVEVPDQLDVDDRGGKRIAQTLALPMTFPDGTAITMLSRIRTQRSLKIRNAYTFRLAYWSMLLEPTDIVTLPVEVIGVKTAVRITSMQEDPANGFTFTAEDYPAGVMSAAAYQPQPGDGYKENQGGTTATLPTVIVDTHTTRGGGVDNIWPRSEERRVG